MCAGRDYGMKLAGVYAMDTLRLEMGFPLWGQDLDTEITPLEAGLEFAMDMNKVRKFPTYLIKSCHWPKLLKVRD